MDMALQKQQVYCRSVQGFPLVTCTLIRRYLCFQISHLASNNMFLVGSFLGGLLLGFSVWQLLQFPLTSKHHALTILLRYLIRKSIYAIRLGVRWCVHPTRNFWFNSKNQKVLEVDFHYICTILKHAMSSEAFLHIPVLNIHRSSIYDQLVMWDLNKNSETPTLPLICGIATEVRE